MSEETNTAQVEIAGMSLSGSKLLLLIPLLGSIGGALWGGFEVYQRLLDAEEAIVNYVSPDMSGIDQQLAVQQTRITDFDRAINEQYRVTTDLLAQLNSRVAESNQLSKDTELFVRSVDRQVSETQRELRNNVYAMEQTLNDRMREIDRDLRTLREELTAKIQRMLDNPLNSSE
jgi:hypothetical protein